MPYKKKTQVKKPIKVVVKVKKLPKDTLKIAVMKRGR